MAIATILLGRSGAVRRGGRFPRLWKALTGLAAGALLTAGLLGLFELGSLAHVPSVPFRVFEWLIRVLPGRLVTFGLDQTLRVLQNLGFNIKNTAKTAEEALALTMLFVAGWIVGLLFFSLIKRNDPTRVRRYGLAVGAVLGIFSLVIVIIQTQTTSVASGIGLTIWILGLFLFWGWGLARLDLAIAGRREAAPAEVGTEAAPSAAATGPGGAKAGAAPPSAAGPAAAAGPSAGAGPSAAQAPAAAGPAPQPAAQLTVISRRRFIIQMGGLAAAIVVFGAEIGAILRSQSGPVVPPLVKAPIPFPNADSVVQPVPGTRPEYTAVADHYRVNIDFNPPDIPQPYALKIDGLVTRPLSLTLNQLRTGYKPMQQFITLSCISNSIGGPLIGTTLWTGASFRDVLATARPQSGARFAHILSADGFDEEVPLDAISTDPRIMLCYDWNG